MKVTNEHFLLFCCGTERENCSVFRSFVRSFRFLIAAEHVIRKQRGRTRLFFHLLHVSGPVPVTFRPPNMPYTPTRTIFATKDRLRNLRFSRDKNIADKFVLVRLHKELFGFLKASKEYRCDWHVSIIFIRMPIPLAHNLILLLKNRTSNVPSVTTFFRDM